MSNTVKLQYDPNRSSVSEYSFSEQRGSATGDAYVQEQQIPQYEDNTNGVAAVLDKGGVNASTYDGTTSGSLGSVASAVVKASPGTLVQMVVTNNHTANVHLKLHNLTTAPTNASAVDPRGLVFFVPASSTVALGKDFLGPAGTYFSTGIGMSLNNTTGSLNTTNLVNSTTSSLCSAFWRYV